MNIEFKEQNSDHSGPVLDIRAEGTGDAFLMGILFEKICSFNGCVWKVHEGGITLRVPIVEMDEIGVATTKKEAV